MTTTKPKRKTKYNCQRERDRGILYNMSKLGRNEKEGILGPGVSSKRRYPIVRPGTWPITRPLAP
jgi:hypothetical protein